MSGDRISDEAVEAAVLVMAAASDCDWPEVSEGNKRRLRDEVRRALSAALPLLEGGKGEPVAWMVRNTDTGKVYWNEEACVFTDGASADSQADCLNDGDEAAWEAFPLYTVPQPAAQQPAGDGGESFAAWLAREMPPGTIISDPLWWAPRIERAIAALRANTEKSK